MAVKHSLRRYDILDIAEWANESAKSVVTTGEDCITFRWEWDGKEYQIEVAPDEDEQIILHDVFRAAIKMARM
ncbi:hypothetical protein JW319_23600 [Enterobacter cloacae subsp. cloacae]|uniref:hypothetical protein n=1 Tax=Enterobacter cloacae TaxID=550 RepID=UPI001C5B36E5|nr:hypothetical protein [Enterobacter cloacae]MBW4204340.1 hypothetical protein [Enterobacter cloacae subsp. cloacae]